MKLQKHAAAFLVIFEAIDGAIATLDKIPPNPPTPDSNQSLTLALLGKEAPLLEHTTAYVRTVVSSIVTHVGERYAMPSVSAQAKRLEASLGGSAGPVEIKGLLKELRTRLFDELTERQFLYVPPDRVKFFNEPLLMGKEVNDRFPKAIDDIEDAGRCLALGQGTACVMHTMRVMECGLRALGNALGIPYAPSWEAYLRQISSRIDEKHKNKTSKWKKDQVFYRDLSGDLLTVKQAWRNPTMHVDRKYSVEEAEQIFTAAKHFMHRLANHFSEREMMKLLM